MLSSPGSPGTPRKSSFPRLGTWAWLVQPEVTGLGTVTSLGLTVRPGTEGLRSFSCPRAAGPCEGASLLSSSSSSHPAWHSVLGITYPTSLLRPVEGGAFPVPDSEASFLSWCPCLWSQSHHPSASGAHLPLEPTSAGTCPFAGREPWSCLFVSPQPPLTSALSHCTLLAPLTYLQSTHPPLPAEL